MSGSQAQKIGGEIGDVRASIDVDKLNEYIRAHVSVIRAPVSVKQFKVSILEHSRGLVLIVVRVVWTGAVL